MTEKTINILKSLKFGEKYPAHKPIGKQEIEEQSVLSTLYNLGILKQVKYSYSVKDVKYLSKFIELQDFKKLNEYIKNEPINNNVTHNYNNVSQVNHSSGNIELKSPIEQNINNQKPNNPIKTSNLQKLYWVIGILVALTILYEFVIKK